MQLDASRFLEGYHIYYRIKRIEIKVINLYLYGIILADSIGNS